MYHEFKLRTKLIKLGIEIFFLSVSTNRKQTLLILCKLRVNEILFIRINRGEVMKLCSSRFRYRFRLSPRNSDKHANVSKVLIVFAFCDRVLPPLANSGHVYNSNRYYIIRLPALNQLSN